jgi:hypothetical protein
MSWAVNRQKSRPEDMAYGLLGIFEVNMPLLYGEGGLAFRRLQEEIVKRSNDLTIFARDRRPDVTFYGIFADSLLLLLVVHRYNHFSTTLLISRSLTKDYWYLAT